MVAVSYSFQLILSAYSFSLFFQPILSAYSFSALIFS